MSLKLFINFVLLKNLFIYFARDRESEQGRGRERERKRTPSRLHTVSLDPNAGLKPTNFNIMIIPPILYAFL